MNGFFNEVNAVRSVVSTNRQLRLNGHVTRFAHFLRSLFIEVIPLEEDIDFVEVPDVVGQFTLKELKNIILGGDKEWFDFVACVRKAVIDEIKEIGHGAYDIMVSSYHDALSPFKEHNTPIQDIPLSTYMVEYRNDEIIFDKNDEINTGTYLTIHQMTFEGVLDEDVFELDEFDIETALELKETLKRLPINSKQLKPNDEYALRATVVLDNDEFVNSVRVPIFEKGRKAFHKAREVANEIYIANLGKCKKVFVAIDHKHRNKYRRVYGVRITNGLFTEPEVHQTFRLA